MRKRGKASFRSGEDTVKRWDAKYTGETTSKRAKRLMRIMYPQLRQALLDWDMLEVALFLKYADLGIPEELWVYYTAWAKRKGEIGLKFDETTRDEEYAILRAEFITRGLDPDALDELELVIDDWVAMMRGLKCPYEFSDGFETGDVSKWSIITENPFEIITYPVHHGTYAVRGLISDGELQHNVSGNPTEYYIRFYFMLTGTFPATLTETEILRMWNLELSLQIVTGQVPSPRLRLRSLVTGHEASGSSQLVVDQWYCMLLLVEAGKVSAIHKLWLDGNLEIGLAEDASGYQNTHLNLRSVYWVAPYDGRGIMDCIICSKTGAPECKYYASCQA